MLSMGTCCFSPILSWTWHCSSPLSALATSRDLYGAFSLPQLWGNDRSHFTFRSLDGAAHYFWESNCFFLIVSLAFPAKGSRLITAFIYFYLIGFAMTGGVMALTWLVRDTSWQNSQLPLYSVGVGRRSFYWLWPFHTGAPPM